MQANPIREALDSIGVDPVIVAAWLKRESWLDQGSPECFQCRQDLKWSGAGWECECECGRADLEDEDIAHLLYDLIEGQSGE